MKKLTITVDENGEIKVYSGEMRAYEIIGLLQMTATHMLAQEAQPKQKEQE
ncbi:MULTISPECIES: hypothetical protein [Bacillus cereus group]|uniref:hypothetical protein n=1 Tax=Bacillus cereus group TaxID=86661 RepID=UPI001481FC79|nr:MULTISPECIES: hypothetical protein [Bacillus cereus group]MDA1557715.1 hypothetical protein [Bacillus cereus]